MLYRNGYGEFPGASMVRTLYFHCRGHRFDPWSGNYNKIPHASVKKQEKRNGYDVGGGGPQRDKGN